MDKYGNKKLEMDSGELEKPEDTNISSKANNKKRSSIEYVNTNPNIKTQIHNSGERVSLYHQLRYNKQHGLLPAQQDRLSKRRSKSGSSSYLKGTVAKYYSERKERLKRLEQEKQKQIELGLRKFRIYRENNSQRKTSLQEIKPENNFHKSVPKVSNETEKTDFLNQPTNLDVGVGLKMHINSNASTELAMDLNPKADRKVLIIKRRPRRKRAQI